PADASHYHLPLHDALPILSEIICEAETHIGETVTNAHEPVQDQDLPAHAITHAARHAAKDLGAKAIAVLTITGKTAVFLSKFRPDRKSTRLNSSHVKISYA